jgi:uncharacterized membrane protein
MTATPFLKMYAVGLATSFAADLTGLALLSGFPLAVARVDLAWGACLSAAVSAIVVLSSRSWS